MSATETSPEQGDEGWRLKIQSRYVWFAIGLLLSVAGYLITQLDTRNLVDSTKQAGGLLLIIMGALAIIGVIAKSLNKNDGEGRNKNAPSSAPSITESEAKMLWDWASKQDSVSINEFATAIVGIGALFFAYASIKPPNTALLVASIGFAGSVILWFHLYAARKEFYIITEALENYSFVKGFKKVRDWRKERKDRFVYQPVTRLMTYFMGLVSWAWLNLILSRTGLAHVGALLVPDVAILVFTLGLVILRKHQDAGETRRKLIQPFEILPDGHSPQVGNTDQRAITSSKV